MSNENVNIKYELIPYDSFIGSKEFDFDKAIYDLAKQGKKSGEIAEILGVSKSSIDHSDGWKNRKNDEFVF